MTDSPNFILPPGSRQAVGLTGPLTPPPAINEPMPIVLDKELPAATPYRLQALVYRPGFLNSALQWSPIPGGDPSGGSQGNPAFVWRGPQGQYKVDVTINFAADGQFWCDLDARFILFNIAEAPSSLTGSEWVGSTSISGITSPTIPNSFQFAANIGLVSWFNHAVVPPGARITGGYVDLLLVNPL